MAIRVNIHLKLAAAVRVKRAARISVRRIATRGMANSKQAESLGRPASARDSPEGSTLRHSGNSLMHATGPDSNHTFCRGLPRDIIPESRVHRFIEAPDVSTV
jgi:hypothetical protein